MRALHKTTIVIWSREKTDEMSGEDLARDADQGNSYCSVKNCVLVRKPDEDDDWDDTDFFDEDVDEAEEEEDEEDEDEDDEDEDDMDEDDVDEDDDDAPK